VASSSGFRSDRRNFKKTIQYFQEWVKQRGLRHSKPRTRAEAHVVSNIAVTKDGDPNGKSSMHTLCTSHLSEKKAARLTGKLTKPV